MVENIKYIAIGRWGIMKNYIGVAAAISIFILSIIFLYFNPYSKQLLDKDLYITVFFMFLFPSFLAVIATVARKKAFYGRLLHVDVTRNSLFECSCNILVMEFIYYIFNDLFSIYRLDEREKCLKSSSLFYYVFETAHYVHIVKK